jgi:hypothetical protein
MVRGIDRGRGWLGAAVLAFRYQTGIRPVSEAASPQVGGPPLGPPPSKQRQIRAWMGSDHLGSTRPELRRSRYQTGIRAAQTKEVPITRHLSDLRFLSLRGLDLNQRPLGYESVSRSAQAYPLLSGRVR